jgi:hypothetical protein
MRKWICESSGQSPEVFFYPKRMLKNSWKSVFIMDEDFTDPRQKVNDFSAGHIIAMDSGTSKWIMQGTNTPYNFVKE